MFLIKISNLQCRFLNIVARRSDSLPLLGNLRKLNQQVVTFNRRSVIVNGSFLKFDRYFADRICIVRERSILSPCHCLINGPSWRKTQSNIPWGHEYVLQGRGTDPCPTHGFPLCCGGGWVHLLYLSWVPPPQVRWQLLQVFHGLQPPLTAGKAITKYYFKHIIPAPLLSCLFVSLIRSFVSLINVPITIPGQGPTLQLRVAMESPIQSLPPCVGEGLLQLRLRLWIPPLQLTEHALHACQEPHWPFTVWNKTNNI